MKSSEQHSCRNPLQSSHSEREFLPLQLPPGLHHTLKRFVWNLHKIGFLRETTPPVELVRSQVEQTSEVRLFHRKPNSAGKIGSGGENLAHLLSGQPQVPRSKVTHPRGQLWRASTGSPSRPEQSWPWWHPQKKTGCGLSGTGGP